MSRNNKLISENLRTEIAKELGVYEQVKKDLNLLSRIYLTGDWFPLLDTARIMTPVMFWMFSIILMLSEKISAQIFNMIFFS